MATTDEADLTESWEKVRGVFFGRTWFEQRASAVLWQIDARYREREASA